MPAYMIFTREGPVRDEAEMAEYARKNAANGAIYAEKYGVTALAFYGALETIEGEGPDGVVVLEFADAAAARAWYNGPEYQDALPHRIKAATYRCTIVDGV